VNKALLNKNLKSILESDINVIFALLFGSIAKNNMRYGSDIDIAVYFKNAPTLYEIGNLNLKLEEIVNYKLDLVELNNLDRINPVLAYSVISDGILICNKDEKIFTEFKKSVLLRYLDFKPTSDIINTAFNKRLADNRFAVFDK
jgi:predicted nucleotidyltransferase